VSGEAFLSTSNAVKPLGSRDFAPDHAGRAYTAHQIPKLAAPSPKAHPVYAAQPNAVKGCTVRKTPGEQFRGSFNNTD